MSTLLSRVAWRAGWLANGARSATPSGQQWARFHQAATQTAFYQEAGGAKWLGWARDRNQLARIPPVDLGRYYSDVKQFRNPRAPNPAPAPLDAPWNPPPTVAAIAPWFRLEGRVHTLVEPSCQELMRVKPEAIAAPVVFLKGLAEAITEQRLQLPSLRFGVIAWTGVSRPAVTAADRDLFWRAFQVPLFQQFRGFLGEPLAGECSCHDGMHIRTTHAEWNQRQGAQGELLVTNFTNLRYPVFQLGSGFRGRIDHSLCPCGRPEPRIMELRPLA